MSLPLVSIIVPIYNAAPDLARCIESVRRQTYADIEILLVNDGSSDASLPICEMYARVDPRVQVIDRRNAGVSAARNAAIAQARGKFLQFADSDDYLAPTATERFVECAERCDADMVIAHYWRVVGEECSERGFLPGGPVLDKLEFAKNLMEEPASFYYGVMWNKLYRRELIAAHHIECNVELGWSEDFLFNLEYIRYADRFAALDEPLYYYVKNEKSITATQIHWRSALETKWNLFAYYKELYTSIGLYEKYRPQIYKYLIANAANG